MAGITTHVLDTAKGRPAAGIGIMLEVLRDADDWQLVHRGATDQDGRLRLADTAERASYRLTFATGDYNPDGFFPAVRIEFRIENPEQHHHVPLLLSPFGYSTYRGS